MDPGALNYLVTCSQTFFVVLTLSAVCGVKTWVDWQILSYFWDATVYFKIAMVDFNVIHANDIEVNCALMTSRKRKIPIFGQWWHCHCDDDNIIVSRQWEKNLIISQQWEKNTHCWPTMTPSSLWSLAKNEKKFFMTSKSTASMVDFKVNRIPVWLQKHP